MVLSFMALKVFLSPLEFFRFLSKNIRHNVAYLYAKNERVLASSLRDRAILNQF